MNTVLLVVHVLTCLVAVDFLPVYGQTTCCANCCDDNCDAPDPYNVTLAEFVADQPLYVALYPNVPVFAGVDSSCYTFFLLPDGTYLMNVVRQYVNGLNSTEEFTIDQQDLGVFQAGSATCVEQITIFDKIDCDDCELYLAYLCFPFGDCSLSEGNDIPVMAFTPNNEAISEDCYDLAIDSIERNGIPSQNYTIVPMEGDPSCIQEIHCTPPVA